MATPQQLRFPPGEFDVKTPVGDAALPALIEVIAAAPARLREAVRGLNDQQLDTPHGPDGWTARQVVHHLADSHLNSLACMKQALTEDEPIFKPYWHGRHPIAHIMSLREREGW